MRMNARPTIVSSGTGPKTRLSAESPRLSPITQTWPSGTVTWLIHAIGDDPFCRYGSSSRRPLT